jgi:hypothetical protein
MLSRRLGKGILSVKKTHCLLARYSQDSSVLTSFEKRKKLGSGNLILIAALGTACGVSATCYFGPKSDNKQFRHAAALLNATYRIFNMVKVSTILAVDYGWIIFQQKGMKSPVDAAADELKQSNDAFVDLLRRKQHGEKVSEEEVQKLRDRIEIGGKVGFCIYLLFYIYFFTIFFSIYHNEYFECTVQVMADLMSDPNSSPFHTVHVRSAQRLKNMCMQNKGIYIKLGQHLAQLDYMLPPEYIDELRELLANNPVSSTESVRRTIKGIIYN